MSEPEDSGLAEFFVEGVEPVDEHLLGDLRHLRQIDVGPELRLVVEHEHVLRDVHRVDDVSFYRGSTSAGRFEQFHYSAGELSGVIEIERGRNGQNTVTIYRVWKNRGPTREQLDETRALMDAVYASLRRRVPDLPPATQIKEELIHPPVR